MTEQKAILRTSTLSKIGQLDPEQFNAIGAALFLRGELAALEDNLQAIIARQSQVAGVETVSDAKFLKKLRYTFPDARILYPASGGDCNLERFFDRKNIYYLDLEMQPVMRSRGLFGRKPPRHFVQANYRNLPFPNNTFDILFYQDNHAPLPAFREMLRTLKPNGLVIYNTRICHSDMTPAEISSVPELHHATLPFVNHTYWTLTKAA